MKTKSLLTGICLLTASLVMGQLPRIVLEPSAGGAAQVFISMDDAFAAAQANDRLYFSGGLFQLTNAIQIDFPIHFIGAGIHPDSTVTTNTTIIRSPGAIVITTSGSNSTFTGLDLGTVSGTGSIIIYGTSDLDDDPTGMLFERCEFQKNVEVSSVGFNDVNSSESTFNECVFHDAIDGAISSSATMTRCIFSNQFADVKTFDSGGLLVDHCIFFDGAKISNSIGSMVRNTIFATTESALYQCSGSTVMNCMTYHTAFFGNSSGTEVNVHVNQSNPFVNESNDEFDHTDDLNIIGGSVANNGAIDGTDMGLYGSPTPAKPGFIPYNPHYQVVMIDPATDGNGDLPVNIKVQAQTH